ncbi:cytochrome P450 [Luteolibacter sp. GHJ8]|uniref:Cytochrome P450 n=1 Tax=Luteolibacter rhizosphaerae TaxID=2989719 RepID=A0ABT3GA24_9BACT|nr:cytochrome P450 [Luteolibacter rhizosphaerae]MCW1916686.1 cytochrome P450 [Luteolibacter rhizosphaerae]
MDESRDPFREARRRSGILECEFQGEQVPMILGHAEVRAAAKDWQTFSSDAPFRVPIPSEEEMRTVRQLPIETDPPQHTAYREIVEPFFRRPKDPEFVQRVRLLVRELLGGALSRPEVEVVRELALPFQSRALTYLLDVPESEAKTWIGWGIHVFKDGADGEVKGAELERYIHAQLDRAEASPGQDFFSALVIAEYDGRKLSREEMLGFANLTFAGGRDTVIHTVSSVVDYLAAHPEALAFLREDSKRVIHASEEFFRVFMPLTHIGRVCPGGAELPGKTMAPGDRISLCWASANRDESVFAEADEIRLDRKPNPHLSFGFGTHICLGAAHARLLVRVLLEELAAGIAGIRVISSVPHVEKAAAYRRMTGFDELRVAFSGL